MYILTNVRQTVLYVGVTSNLVRRVEEHRLKLVNGFCARYNVDRLVYYEVVGDVVSAIEREKVLERGKSEKED